MLAHSALTAAVAGIFHHCKATFIPGARRGPVKCFGSRDEWQRDREE